MPSDDINDKSDLSKMITTSKRDKKIQNAILDIQLYKDNFLPTQTTERICICHQNKNENPIFCDGCGVWYHKSCLGLENLNDEFYAFDIWHCNICLANSVWTARCSGLLHQ